MRAALWPAAALLSGCAYFNGMYNANHWSSQAERSERAGRTAEARQRWQMAETHADSVLSRHPHSRWANDAMLVRGRALVHLQLNNDAVGVLQQATQRLPPGTSLSTAQLYLGRANLALGRLPEARAALDSAALASDARVRSLALLYRGRVLLALHEPAAALEDFTASAEPEARFERARAALAGGAAATAADYLDQVADAKPFRENLWLPALDSLALAGMPERSSALVTRVSARSDVTSGGRARLLLADGDRLHARGDDSAAAGRWRDVERIVPDSAEARGAELRMARLSLAAATNPEGLLPLEQQLATIVAAGGESGAQARDLGRLMAFADTLEVMPGSRDAYWFLRAEVLRDSLNARAAAAVAFAAMAARFPESPWAPKALVAAIVAGHPAADSLREVLRQHYADSPYLAAVEGRPGLDPQYAALEDSLRATLAGVQGSSFVTPDRLREPASDEPGVRGPPRPVVRPGTAPTTARPTARPQPDP